VFEAPEPGDFAVGLAKGLGLTTTAEGVENVEQCTSLRAYGCTKGQGYLFGRAMPTRTFRR
jgi:EAL domain-containing protein (putative c-di-GMP-specific phosphodiesterase class I)